MAAAQEFRDRVAEIESGTGVSFLKAPRHGGSRSSRDAVVALKAAGGSRKARGALKLAVQEIVMANAGKPVRVYEVAEGLAAQGVKVGKANLSTILRRLAAAHPQHIKISKNGRNLLYAYIGSSGSAMSS